MANFYVGSITSYEPTTGQYYVRLQGSSLDTLKGVPCRTLSPTPYEDGSGLKAAPVAPVDSQCLVYEQGQRRYIVGFCSPHGSIAHGDVKPVRDVNPGDVFITHSTPSRLGILAEGTIVATAAKWAKAALNPITQQFTATVRNFRLNLYSMILEYFADESNKTGTARIAMTKWVNPKGLPINPPDGSFPITPDNFTLRAGTLDDSHILELNINQKYVGDNPQYISGTFIGTQKDGTFFKHDVTNAASDGSSTNMSILAKVDGTLLTTFGKTGGNFVNTTVDITGNTGKPGLLIDVSGKAQVSISKSGDVTITTVDGANIKLGGTGKEQPLVTKSFLDLYYANHIHSNGNQGAPTGPPMPPAVQTLGADSPTNPVTFTTQAE